MIKKNKYLILVFIINICIIFGINYLIGNSINDNKYGIGKDYIKFVRKDWDKDSNIDFLLDFKNIIAVGETNDERLLGLYDPDMKYYLEATKIISLTKYRYFSSEDYEKRRDVSVVIDSVERNLIGESDINKEYIENRYNTEIINAFDYNSLIYEDNILIIKNIFSIRSKEIHSIYIDNIDENYKDEITNKFKSEGFIEAKRSHFYKFVNLINYSFNSRIYNKAIILSVFLVYFILIFLIYIYIKDMSRYILIHNINGASLGSFIFHFFKSNILNLIIILYSSTLVSKLYLKLISNYRMNIFYNIFINVLTFFIIIIFIFCKIIFSYKKEFYL